VRARRKLVVIVIAFTITLGAGILIANQWFRPAPVLKVALKRYGRTLEGQPVAWLVLTNTSRFRVSILGDLNPVTTAHCEYRQQLPEGTRTWIYNPPSHSGPFPVRPGENLSVRVLLPTNGHPVRVKLLADVPRTSDLWRRLRPVRHWLYRTGLLSPLTKVNVPFDLLATNVVTRFID
jgi:hypothetical protein